MAEGETDAAKLHNSTFPGVSHAIEAVGKAFLFVGVACYIAGLLVVNFYLRQFGTSDFSLLRTRFVLTGAIALLPLAVFMVWLWTTLVILGWHRLEGGVLPILDRSLIHKPGPRRRRSLMLLLFVPIAFLLVYASLLRMDITNDTLLLIFVVILIILCSFAHLYSFAMLVQPSLLIFDKRTLAEFGMESNATLAKSVPALRLAWMAAISILAFLVSVLYLSTFAGICYPRISGQVGGGQASIVQLVVLNDHVDEIEQLGVVLEGLRSVPLPLLWEGESSYLVAFPEHPSPGWTAQINKSMLAGILSVPQDQRPRMVLPPHWSPGNMSFETGTPTTEATPLSGVP